MSLSYRSPKTEVRESKIHGRGLFASADIAKDEVVAVKGGHIVDRKTLRERIAPLLGPVEIQIDDNLFIAPVTQEERELSMLYSNHSCNPNLGIRGEWQRYSKVGSDNTGGDGDIDVFSLAVVWRFK